MDSGLDSGMDLGVDFSLGAGEGASGRAFLVGVGKSQRNFLFRFHVFSFFLSRIALKALFIPLSGRRNVERGVGVHGAGKVILMLRE